jgi:hypothetical protein
VLSFFNHSISCSQQVLLAWMTASTDHRARPCKSRNRVRLTFGWFFNNQIVTISTRYAGIGWRLLLSILGDHNLPAESTLMLRSKSNGKPNVMNL